MVRSLSAMGCAFVLFACSGRLPDAPRPEGGPPAAEARHAAPPHLPRAPSAAEVDLLLLATIVDLYPSLTFVHSYCDAIGRGTGLAWRRGPEGGTRAFDGAEGASSVEMVFDPMGRPVERRSYGHGRHVMTRRLVWLDGVRIGATTLVLNPEEWPTTDHMQIVWEGRRIVALDEGRSPHGSTRRTELRYDDDGRLAEVRVRAESRHGPPPHRHAHRYDVRWDGGRCRIVLREGGDPGVAPPHPSAEWPGSASFFVPLTISPSSIAP
jgi:YD repeat-containing protein